MHTSAWTDQGHSLVREQLSPLLLVALLIPLACGATRRDEPQQDPPLHEGGTGGVTMRNGESGASNAESGSLTARAGTGNEPTAGALNLGDTCPELRDPAAMCPASRPMQTSDCVAGAICDYDTCSDGCNSAQFCPLPGEPWVGSSRVCGGPCELPVKEAPWARTRHLLFANLDGDCGELGAIDYDPSEQRLAALPCSVEVDRQEGCVFERSIVCSSGDTKLSVDMRVAFRETRGFRGEASVTVAGTGACQGDYSLGM